MLNVMDTDLPAIWYPHLGPVANAIWWVAVPLFVHVIESPTLIVSSFGLSECVPLIAITGPLAAAVEAHDAAAAAPPGVGGGAVGMVNELRSPPPLSVGADDPPPPHAVATTRTNTAAEPASKRMWFTPMSFRCDGSYVPGQFRNGTQSASALLAVPTHNFIKGPAASGARCSLDQACLCGIAEVHDEFAVLVGGIAKDRAT